MVQHLGKLKLEHILGCDLCKRRLKALHEGYTPRQAASIKIVGRT